MAKGRTGRDWDGQNRANIDKYTRQIKSLFNSIAGEAALIGSSVDTVNPDRLFTFADYPKTKQRADKLISNLQNDLNTIIVNGVRSSWTLSNNKNNELARQVFGNNVGKLSKAEYRRYFSNNGVALDQFINRKENGLNLSDRVWRYSQQFKKEIEMGLDIGIGNGLSADQMARDLKQYLQFPDKLFRRVRDKHGELQLSKAAQAFHPGAGVYRSSYKNAMRLSRTENNMAYRASDHERWNEFDFVVGIQIKLSNNPTHCPMCEALAGKYPKTFKFVGWHPQCRCAAIPILKTPDELAEETKAILAGEPTTTESSKEVTDLPPNFKSWMNDNKKRLERAKSKPYFLRDNESYLTESRKPLTEKTNKKIEPLKSEAKLITKEIKSIKDIDALFKNYATLYPEDFFAGKIEIGKFSRKATGSSYTMMRAYNEIGCIDLNSESINLASIGTYNPFEATKQALNIIRTGGTLEFKHEYALESIYHEILHLKAKKNEVLSLYGRDDYKTTAMEIVNQFVARHDYEIFIERLGGKAVNKEKVLKDGLGYGGWITRFREVFEVSKIEETTVLPKLRKMLLEEKYTEIETKLATLIREKTGIKFQDKEILSGLEKGGSKWAEIIEAIKTVN